MAFPDEPPDEGAPFFSDDDRTGRAGFVPEFVRKMAIAGLGAVFMTEEGLRSLASQLKLPKEALGFILSQAEKTKDDIGRVVSEELRRFFQSEKLRSEFLKLLAGTTIEIQARVRLVPTEEGDGEPRVNAKVDIDDLQARRGRRRKDSGK